MKKADIERLACVDCRGDLTLEKGTYTQKGSLIDNALLCCTHCSRAYPVIGGVGIFFKKEVLPSYLKEWEINKIVELGYETALDGMELSTLDAISDQVQVADNWEYQHEKVLRWEEETDTGKYHSRQMFWRFIRIDPQEMVGKDVLTACVGRGKEVFHVLQAGAAQVVVAEIGAEIHAIP
ncbi:MAG: Trm112 family protein, partial [Magnetococcales bacterium]|nr:Trm112 family protein [Magnetococcales bacterium]